MKARTKVKSRDELARKLLKGSFWVALFFFGLLVIFKSVVPSNHAGWGIIPLIDYILMSGFILCFICLAGTYGFQAWTKNEEEYYHWLISLGILRKSNVRFLSSFYSKGTYLWSARLIPLITLLFFIVFVVLTTT